MYFGNVSDDEQAVIEEITLTPKEYRNCVTGLYAPAGEVVKIEISSQDLEKIGGLTISVGQISHVNRNNNIWKAKDNFYRMANLGNIFTINKETSFVGNQYNPTLLNYTELGHKTFNQVTKPSTFGFIIEGNGRINYSFKGTQFGLVLRQNMDSKLKSL